MNLRELARSTRGRGRGHSLDIALGSAGFSSWKAGIVGLPFSQDGWPEARIRAFFSRLDVVCCKWLDFPSHDNARSRVRVKDQTRFGEKSQKDELITTIPRGQPKVKAPVL
jgi:hypothetical protein